MGYIGRVNKLKFIEKAIRSKSIGRNGWQSGSRGGRKEEEDKRIGHENWK